VAVGDLLTLGRNLELSNMLAGIYFRLMPIIICREVGQAGI
jgi:hypothetical protein